MQFSNTSAATKRSDCAISSCRLVIMPFSKAMRCANQYNAAICVENALVEATAISGPAWVSKKPPDSRTIVLDATLVKATVGAAIEFIKRIASRVSAVSPDWEIAIYKLFLSEKKVMYLNSE